MSRGGVTAVQLWTPQVIAMQPVPYDLFNPSAEEMRRAAELLVQELVLTGAAVAGVRGRLPPRH